MKNPLENDLGTPVDADVRPRGRRKMRDADATKDAILSAATAEFAEKGLFGARVEEIASRTATSKHMIYYYFGSKDGLYSAVLTRAYEGFRKAESDIDYDRLDPVEALSVLVGSTFDAHYDNPETIRILMSENLDAARHAKEIDHSGQRRLVLEKTQAIIDRGVAAGLFNADIDALQFHLMISSFSFFFVANRYTFGEVFDIDMTKADFVARSRAEFITTMLRRCLK